MQYSSLLRRIYLWDVALALHIHEPHDALSREHANLMPLANEVEPSLVDAEFLATINSAKASAVGCGLLARA